MVRLLVDFLCTTWRFYLLILVLTLTILLGIHAALREFFRGKIRVGAVEVAVLSGVSILVIAVYFALKTASATLTPSSLIIRIETPVWREVILPCVRVIAKRSFIMKMLDGFYIPFWGFLCVAPFGVVFDPLPETRRGFFLGLWFAYLICGVLYLVLPTWSPVYSFGEVFTEIPAPISLHLHEHSLTVTELLHRGASIREVIGRAGYPFQPIAAFPSFHVAYVVLICFWAGWKVKNRYGGVVLAALPAAYAAAGILLGFHWILDAAAGGIIGYAGWRIGLLSQGFLKDTLRPFCGKFGPRRRPLRPHGGKLAP